MFTLYHLNYTGHAVLIQSVNEILIVCEIWNQRRHSDINEKQFTGRINYTCLDNELLSKHQSNLLIMQGNYQKRCRDFHGVLSIF